MIEADPLSPGGTDDVLFSSGRPYGTNGGLLALFPPINRWAILTGPSRTEDEDLNWWQEILYIVLFVLAGSVRRTRG